MCSKVALSCLITHALMVYVRISVEWGGVVNIKFYR